MKKEALLPPLQHHIWQSTFLVCTILTTILSGLFQVPVPGALELSQNTLREELLWGEILFQSEYLLLILLIGVTIYSICKVKNYLYSFSQLLLLLSWFHVKSKSLIPDSLGDSESTLIAPLTDRSVLYTVRLFIMNVAILPVLLWTTTAVRIHTKAIAQSITLPIGVLFCASLVLWVLNPFIELSTLYKSLQNVPIMGTIVPTVILLACRLWSKRESA